MKRVLKGERALLGRNRTQARNHGTVQRSVLFGLQSRGEIRTEHQTWNQKAYF